MTRDEPRTDRDDCWICGTGHKELLERHHLVPRRFGGGDGQHNMVEVCASCHRALERLYSQRFYETITTHIRRKLDQEDPETHYVRGVREAADVVWETFIYGNNEYDGELMDAMMAELAELAGDEYRSCRGCSKPALEEPCEHCGVAPRVVADGN